MKPVVMPLWPMKPIRNESRRSSTKMSNPVSSEGDLVLLYDQESDKLGAGKFKSLWMGPYIVKHVLAKGAYELVDYDGIPLVQP